VCVARVHVHSFLIFFFLGGANLCVRVTAAGWGGERVMLLVARIVCRAVLSVCRSVISVHTAILSVKGLFHCI